MKNHYQTKILQGAYRHDSGCKTTDSHKRIHFLRLLYSPQRDKNMCKVFFIFALCRLLCGCMHAFARTVVAATMVVVVVMVTVRSVPYRILDEKNVMKHRKQRCNQTI